MTVTFNPATNSWFSDEVGTPTDCQREAWRAIESGAHTLVCAPTGSGKTLAAFLHSIDQLVSEAQRDALPNETRIVYVSPLKALSNDIQRNLELPLAGIQAAAAELSDSAGPAAVLGLPTHPRNAVGTQTYTQTGTQTGTRARIPPGIPAGIQAGENTEVQPGPPLSPSIRSQVRTGDTPASARQAMTRNPPHILVTTPESLFILLTSDSGRRMLETARTVIVDEIHAIAGSKRGAHLALSLERLDALASAPLQRIGLSATQKPIERLAAFLTGASGACTIVDRGHTRERELSLLLPPSPLEAIMSAEVWEEVYDRLATACEGNRTTLIFVNTRRLAERISRHVGERVGEERICAHHGSLARELRLSAEQRLKNGELTVLVATASLELGIDIGDVDQVIQIGSPRSIAAFLQRVGRSGHGVDRVPVGKLVPLSRDDLAECAALLREVGIGALDQLTIPHAPLDVLAQQIVAMAACEEWGDDQLLALIRRANPYQSLGEATLQSLLSMLSEGFSTRRGRRSAYLYRDGVNRRIRGKRGARLTALTSGGAIPETADYAVVNEPSGDRVGTLNEDFAIESLPGDIFQLGSTSWRILRVEPGKVRVEDAHGQPPTLPFWLGEAPARTAELSRAVSDLRVCVNDALNGHSPDDVSAACELVTRALMDSYPVDEFAAVQLAEYLVSAYVALGQLPTQNAPSVERFFDESGGMQLVVHAPFGARVNRAWGLSLRKRFCRQFNFELQAAATDDTIILSLGETHSFPLDDVEKMLHPNTVRGVLEQAVLDSPIFTARWRWNANISLAVPRVAGGKKVPPPIQRMQAEDLISVVFPDQIACAENLGGEREIPDHPLVAQTMHDALFEGMDLAGFTALLEDIRSGKVPLLCKDTTEPSPLAAECLSAKPYAFLDDAPLEERRTQAVMSRRWNDVAQARDLGKLDTGAIARVRQEAWPPLVTPDDIHDALMTLGYLTDQELAQVDMSSLTGEARACHLPLEPGSAGGLWFAAERAYEFRALYLGDDIPADIPASPARREGAPLAIEPHDALVRIVRSRLEGTGPVTVARLAGELSLPRGGIEAALSALEVDGFAMRGSFESPDVSDDGPDATQWCERRLLARIHRYTVQRLRREIEPVSTEIFMRFLFRWQGLEPSERRSGPEGLRHILAQLEGFEGPAASWEDDLLPARIRHYTGSWLDSLCLSGQVTWIRRSAATTRPDARARTPITFVSRRNLPLWLHSATNNAARLAECSPLANRVFTAMTQGGPVFFDDLAGTLDLPSFQVRDALSELAASGLVHADAYAGFRTLSSPPRKRRRTAHVKPAFQDLFLRHGAPGDLNEHGDPHSNDGGRWATLMRPDAPPTSPPRRYDNDASGRVALAAATLLMRYGVVFKSLLARESDLPPWRELAAYYRTLEARGDLRGGRFVAGLTGEQFALPSAVAMMRRVRREAAADTPSTQATISISAVDPLNLAGIILPGDRIPSLPSNRLLFEGGTLIAAEIGGKPVSYRSQDLSWPMLNQLKRQARAR